jgi:hypothetical protein
VKDFYVKDAPSRENQEVASFFLVASKHCMISVRCGHLCQRAHPAGIAAADHYLQACLTCKRRFGGVL